MPCLLVANSLAKIKDGKRDSSLPVQVFKALRIQDATLPFDLIPPAAHETFSAMRSRVFRLFSFAFSLSFVLMAAHADWPQFRGPWGDGHATAPGDNTSLGLPIQWSETNNVRWKTEIPNRGWSTPVIMGGQVWVTSATVEGHDFYAICVDEATGKIIYNENVFHSADPEPLGNGASMNCYATPSPLIEPGRVFVHFGSFGTACLDTKTGKVIWKRDDLKCRHYRGPSSSLAAWNNLLILTFDGADLQYLAALDKETGKTVWKTDRSADWNDQNSTSAMVREGDQRKAHSTPLIVNASGKPQIISGGAKATYGYDPSSGKEIWKVNYVDFSVAPVPLYDDGKAFIVTGLSKNEMWAVRTDGAGDVTDSHVLWKDKTHIGKYASPILVDGLIYTAAEQSFLTCLDEQNGQPVWTERIGGRYAASPIYADGRIYFFSQEGVTTVIKPGRSLQILSTNTLDDGFMASPAVSDKALFLRTKTHLYRVESLLQKS
jgi:outer membrane protein assembly factor BamB